MTNSGSPIKPNSKKENPSKPALIKALFTMMFGGVPVKVSKPPVFDPNATGINIFDGIVPILHADAIEVGKRVATVPVLLTNPERIPEPNVIITNNFGILFPAKAINFLPAKAVHPVCDKPSPMINNEPIIITVGLLNPLRVSETVRIPHKNKLSMETKATTSGGYFPQINKPIVMVKITSINVIKSNLLSFFLFLYRDKFRANLSLFL